MIQKYSSHEKLEQNFPSISLMFDPVLFQDWHILVWILLYTASLFFPTQDNQFVLLIC